MYYDPLTGDVIDYHHGLEDGKKRVLRMIGDPAARYREDPVRIIRAVRFAAKLNNLGFKIEPRTAKPLKASVGLLADVPQSRLFDEMLKLLQTGHALASIAQLKTLGMARGIYPLLDVVVERVDSEFVNAALQDTDRRVGEGKPVAPSFLLACVLWADVREGWQVRSAEMPTFPALQEAIEDVFNARIGDVSGRGKLAGDMREIWTMQPRFDKRNGSAPFGLVEQARFRAGFDFMRLRAEVGEIEEELADWWETFSTASDDTRTDMLQAVKPAPRAVKADGTPVARKRPRRRRKPAGSGPSSGGDTAA
jgi:poly(A) polymerase